MWEVEYTDEFGEWWDRLDADEQASLDASVELLKTFGPALGRPHADTIEGSDFPNMKELRTQHEGRPYRTLFAFDPRRAAILLLGGDKTGDDRWYEKHIPIADRLYRAHLRSLEAENSHG